MIAKTTWNSISGWTNFFRVSVMNRKSIEEGHETIDYPSEKGVYFERQGDSWVMRHKAIPLESVEISPVLELVERYSQAPRKIAHELRAVTDENLTEGQLLHLVLGNPILAYRLRERLNKEIDKEHRHKLRKIAESMYILKEALDGTRDDETLNDICCGGGDLCTIAQSLGKVCGGFDINPRILAKGNALKLKLVANATRMKTHDVFSGITEAGIWISKHPCGPGGSIPDKIIQEFLFNTNVHRLVLLTCCMNTSIGHCPESYLQAGLVTKEAWDITCRNTQPNQTDSPVNMEKINTIRMEFARKQGVSAKLTIVPGSIMNQMLTLQKK